MAYVTICGTVEQRSANMAAAVASGVPRLQTIGGYHRNKASIVAFGPSLKETWREIQGPIFTVGGAHDFLVNKGILPTFHVEIDVREHKADMVTPVVGVRYLIASCCHPVWWSKLADFDVSYWHVLSADGWEMGWIAKNDPGGLISAFGGGSTAGQRAMTVAAMLGYRDFDVFGMDFCYSGSKTHAAGHSGPEQERIWAKVGDEVFKTSPELAQAAVEMRNFLRTADCQVRFHGEGMMQSIARAIQKETEQNGTARSRMDKRSMDGGDQRQDGGVFPHRTGA